MAYIGRTPTNAALTASDLADGIVSTAKIAADAVTDAKIADDVVGTEHLTANEVDTTALGADAVTGAQLADDAVNSEHYTDGSIDTAHIADAQITKAKLADQVDVFSGTSLNAADLGSGIHIKTADTSSSVSTNADELILEGTRSGMTLLAANNNYSYINFGDSGATGAGSIRYGHPNNDLLFITNGADQWSLDSSGNFLPAATDHGIYLGVTSATAANHLNDYEEGTFTPAYAFDSGSAGMNSGSRGDYVKIGNLVHFQIYMSTDSISSPSGDGTITGLPFTTGDNSSSSAVIGLLYRFGTDFDGELKVRVGQDSTVLSPFKNASNSTSATRFQGSDFTSGTAYNNLHVAGCYSTA